jgi:hypothetical protein
MGSAGLKAARFVERSLTACGHDVTLVDPVEARLPLLDRMYKEYEKGSAPQILECLSLSCCGFGRVGSISALSAAPETIHRRMAITRLRRQLPRALDVRLPCSFLRSECQQPPSRAQDHTQSDDSTWGAGPFRSGPAASERRVCGS